MSELLVPVMAGIGNAVMTVPLARALADHGRVTIEAGNRAIADVFSRLPEVAEVVTLPTGAAGLAAHRRAGRRIRPDAYVVPFPSNRWQYTLLAATSGARRVVMHTYPVGHWRAGRGLLSVMKSLTLVEAIRGLHDVEQNLALVEATAANVTKRSDAQKNAPVFPLTDAERDTGAALHPGRGFIAIQPGCANTVVGAVKRLPTATLAAVIDALAEQGHEVVIIEGPDERGVGGELANETRTRPRIIELHGTLGKSAALLERAALYVGIDSGLAHVSAAVGTPAVTVFAAADPDRVCPYGHRDLVVTPPAVEGKPWRPRLLYPMDHAGPKLREDGIDWARHVRVQDVLEAVERGVRAQEQDRE